MQLLSLPPAIRAALLVALGGGAYSRRQIGAGQQRAMAREPPIAPPTPFGVAGESRQVRRQRARLAAKGKLKMAGYV